MLAMSAAARMTPTTTVARRRRLPMLRLKTMRRTATMRDNWPPLLEGAA
jgi:hypothetical protein